MKQQHGRRAAVILISVHLVMSFVLWGIIRVLQQGYNSTHREPIAMACASVDDGTAIIQVLRKSCEIPVAWMEEESPLYFGLYCLTDGTFHALLYGMNAIMSS